MDNLGYCCINNTLRAQKPSIYSSRGLNRKTFSIQLAAERALLNIKDLYSILQWNDFHNIRVFRIGSEPLPRSGDQHVGYSICDLPNARQLTSLLSSIGQYVVDHNHHISFHPGQYVCLGSPSESVRQLGIYALERENEVADAISSSLDIDIPINIHIGGSYGGEFNATADRFIKSFNSLSHTLQQRLVVENDDKQSGWSITKLYNHIYSKIGIPLTFDIHHSHFSRESTISLYDEYLLAKSTWGNRSMQIHYSQSPTPDKIVTKHSDYYRDPIPSWVDDSCHVHLECKAKELALLDYRKNFSLIKV